MPRGEPSVEVLRIAVDEQRRFHDELTASFSSLRSKILYFIGATLAVMTFLYAGASSASGEGAGVRERLFIPDELYGLIFYFVGLACLLYALAKLVHGAKPDARWRVPFEQEEYATLAEQDEKAYLIKLKDEYVKATAHNLKVHAKKGESITSSFYPLLVGAILLVALRYFQ
ncbi:MAG TPA: hypothetical protein VD735_00965 [Candidatus Saccharimonadales bacterium]|nr:hypothetical protein [Candidatus Saccharimonadales bacterium]